MRRVDVNFLAFLVYAEVPEDISRAGGFDSLDTIRLSCPCLEEKTEGEDTTFSGNIGLYIS